MTSKRADPVSASTVRALVESNDAASMAIVASVVHELNSPLSAVTSNATVARQLVDELPTDERVLELKEILDDVVSASEHLRDLCQEVAAYARGGVDERAGAQVIIERSLKLARSALSRRVRVANRLPEGAGGVELAASSAHALARLLVVLVREVRPQTTPAPVLSVTLESAPGPRLEVRVQPHPGLGEVTSASAELLLAQIGRPEPLEQGPDGVAARAWLGPPT